MIEKKCTKCSLILPETKEFFYRQKTTKSGFRAACKKCCDKKSMEYYHGGAGKEACKKWRENNKEWYKNNKERISKQQKEYRKKNREKINERNRNRRANLSPEELEAQREKDRVSHKRWKSRCTSGIYTITNKINGKVYVGESQVIEVRWIQHKSALKQETKAMCNPELLSDWKTHGKEAFEFKIIKELTDSSKEVRLLEEEKTILDLEQQGVVVYNSNNDRRRING